MTTPWRSTIAAVLVLITTSAWAADPVPGNSTLLSDPIFSALLTDGSTVSGRIRQIGPNGAITLANPDKPDSTIAFERLIKLTREDSLPTLEPKGSLVLFPDGDRLYQSGIGAATDTTLDVNAFGLGNLAIPLDSILGLVLTPPDDADSLDDVLNRVRHEPRNSEVLWTAKNGDRVEGGFLGLDDKRVKFQAKSGPIALDRSRVVALGFDPSLVAYPKPKSGFLELTMADGSRLGVSKPRIEQGQIVAESRFGPTIRVALGELVRIHARSDSVLYLSDRSADRERYVSYVGPTRPYNRNSSVDGHPLRLAGQTYDRGLGTQSRTILVYRLPAGSRRFQALVGLDEGAGPLGSVVFRVFVDNAERFASPAMSARDLPKSIDVDVSGAKALILITEFGERGEVRDFADWIEARIIR